VMWHKRRLKTLDWIGSIAYDLMEVENVSSSEISLLCSRRTDVVEHIRKKFRIKYVEVLARKGNTRTRSSYNMRRE
jgi:hypothetical protein